MDVLRRRTLGSYGQDCINTIMRINEIITENTARFASAFRYHALEKLLAIHKIHRDGIKKQFDTGVDYELKKHGGDLEKAESHAYSNLKKDIWHYTRNDPYTVTSIPAKAPPVEEDVVDFPADHKEKVTWKKQADKLAKASSYYKNSRGVPTDEHPDLRKPKKPTLKRIK